MRTPPLQYQRAQKSSLVAPVLASPRKIGNPIDPLNADCVRRTPDDIARLLGTLAVRANAKRTPSPPSTLTQAFHFLTPPPSPAPSSLTPIEISLNSAPPTQPPSPTFPPFVFSTPSPGIGASFHDALWRRPTMSLSDLEDRTDRGLAFSDTPVTPPKANCYIPASSPSSELEDVRAQLIYQHQIQQGRLGQTPQRTIEHPPASPKTTVTIELAPESSNKNKRVSFLPGDWYCPMVGCGYHNFQRNLECFRCACPHPDRYPPSDVSLTSDPEFNQSTDWLDFLQNKATVNKTSGAMPLGAFGDWRCACGFINWRRRSLCWQCHPTHPSNQDHPTNATATSADKSAVLFPVTITPPTALPPRGEPVRIGQRLRPTASLPSFHDYLQPIGYGRPTSRS